MEEIVNMNVILDTNAIKYYYQIKQGENINIKLNGKQINNDNFVKLCEDARNVFVMSESYFELFFQSYKKDKDLTEVINVYNYLCSSIKKKGNRFCIINDTEGFYFDMKKLIYSVNNGEKVELNDYIGKRVELESELMYRILMIVNYSVIGIVFDNIYDVNFPQNYWEGLFDYIKQELENLYNKYYIEEMIGIKEFEKELDALIYDVLSKVNNNINVLAEIFDNDDTLPHIRGDKCGAEYTAKLIKNLNSIAKKKYNESSMKKFEQNVDDFLKALKEKKQYSSLKVDYLKYLCMEFAKGRKIKKNDIPDYAMVTSFDTFGEVFKDINLKETVLCLLTIL